MIKTFIITIYEENRATSEKKEVFTCTKTTTWTMEQVAALFDYNDSFHITQIDGAVLSFIDFTYFFEVDAKIFDKIESISTTNTSPRIKLPTTSLIRFEEEFNDDLISRHSNELVYVTHRTECGASGYSELTIWASIHPLEMMFIGGMVYDLFKIAIKKLCSIIIKQRANIELKNNCNYIRFSPKKFHKNFSRLVGINETDMQIYQIDKVNIETHNIKVRTIDNQKFNVKINTKGKIISYKLINNK